MLMMSVIRDQVFESPVVRYKNTHFIGCVFVTYSRSYFKNNLFENCRFDRFNGKTITEYSCDVRNCFTETFFGGKIFNKIRKELKVGGSLILEEVNNCEVHLSSRHTLIKNSEETKVECFQREYEGYSLHLLGSRNITCTGKVHTLLLSGEYPDRPPSCSSLFLKRMFLPNRILRCKFLSLEEVAIPSGISCKSLKNIVKNVQEIYVNPTRFDLIESFLEIGFKTGECVFNSQPLIRG